MPQPVSGVASRSRRERNPLANFEAQRLLPVSLRSTRQPANSLIAAGDSARIVSSFGMSAGSFWPSPSSVAIHSPRAALMPVLSAVLCPLCDKCRNTRNSGNCAFAAARTASESSLLESSTYTISKSALPRSAAAISVSNGTMLSRSLCTGTTTDRSGITASLVRFDAQKSKDPHEGTKSSKEFRIEGSKHSALLRVVSAFVVNLALPSSVDSKFVAEILAAPRHDPRHALLDRRRRREAERRVG